MNTKLTEGALFDREKLIEFLATATESSNIDDLLQLAEPLNEEGEEEVEEEQMIYYKVIIKIFILMQHAHVPSESIKQRLEYDIQGCSKHNGKVHFGALICELHESIGEMLGFINPKQRAFKKMISNDIASIFENIFDDNIVDESEE